MAAALGLVSLSQVSKEQEMKTKAPEARACVIKSKADVPLAND